MKNLNIVLTLPILFSLSAYADTPIPQNRLGNYIDAVQLSMRNQNDNFGCNDLIGSSSAGSSAIEIFNEIGIADTGSVSSSSQPVLTLERTYPIGAAQHKTIVRVTSSADYSVVIKLDQIEQVFKGIPDLSTGTVSNEWVTATEVICQ